MARPHEAPPTSEGAAMKAQRRTLIKYMSENPDKSWRQLAVDVREFYAQPGVKLIHVCNNFRLSQPLVNKLLEYK